MVEKRRGWLARVGGKHGKHPIYSYEVVQFASDEECFSLIEKTIEWYQAKGEGRERIGAIFDRLGLASYLDEVVKPLGLEVIETAEERKKYHAGGNLYV